MNKVVMMGRLVGDPKISYSKNGNAMAIARYRLAVARKSKKQGEAAADFFSCVVFGKSAEFAERYLHKGTQICISGRLQTGSYVKPEGHDNGDRGRRYLVCRSEAGEHNAWECDAK